jgi:hypothetical protein
MCRDPSGLFVHSSGSADRNEKRSTASIGINGWRVVGLQRKLYFSFCELPILCIFDDDKSTSMTIVKIRKELSERQ